jgi:D-beta-D-heptose 7-phosphate kinase/D-beta-D-heptose 1-phosphate adenosyltransferase
LELLAKCKDESKKLPNCLVFVGLDSDKRIKTTKGSDRPINDELSRISMMLSMKYVDGVFTFDTEEDLLGLLSEIKPTKIVIGEEYKQKKVVGGEFAEEVIFFPKVKDFSTTNIIKSIKNI